MKEIRIAWKLKGSIPGAGIWSVDNKENRAALSRWIEYYCLKYGKATHFIEERETRHAD